ncbi:MAG TPA: ABC transporter ATP-binding protein [bacterium]|nr:ABC transporter ATP-binding protein [bacterium]
MSGMAILETHGLTMDFRGFRALDGIDLRVEPGELRAVIGPNGAGKTTLFNLLSGLLRPSAGRIEFAGRDITGLAAHELARRGIARSFQITSVFPHLSVLANIELAVQARTALGYVWWGSERLMRRFDGQAQEILAAIGLSGLAEREVATLPYGHKRVLEIGLAIALEPTLLLLDEPTAGLSVADAARIVDVVRRVAGRRTIILVEHNMGVVAQLAQHITVLQRGRVLAEGTYEALRANPAVIEAYLGGVA